MRNASILLAGMAGILPAFAAAQMPPRLPPGRRRSGGRVSQGWARRRPFLRAVSRAETDGCRFPAPFLVFRTHDWQGSCRCMEGGAGGVAAWMPNGKGRGRGGARPPGMTRTSVSLDLSRGMNERWRFPVPLFVFRTHDLQGGTVCRDGGERGPGTPPRGGGPPFPCPRGRVEAPSRHRSADPLHDRTRARAGDGLPRGPATAPTARTR